MDRTKPISPLTTDLTRVDVWLRKFDPQFSPKIIRDKPHRRAARIAIARLCPGEGPAPSSAEGPAPSSGEG